jgi:predicted outer membrane protein
MKLTFSAALAIGLMVAVSASAADKTKKAAKKTPSTLPPTSKMIVLPPPIDSGSKSSEPAKLISSEMSGKDLRFFTTSVEAGRFQSYLVELLKTKAASDQIKALGSALVVTQEQENQQIARLAGIKGWTVSTEPSTEEKAFGKEIEKLGGSNFDKAVMDYLIAVAQQSVSAYEEAVQSTDKDIKSFSEQMLPLAQDKLRYAEKMTGAGKGASQLFRTGAPPKAQLQSKAIAPSKVKSSATLPGSTATPAPAAVAPATPPAIIPSKVRSSATPSGSTATPTPPAIIPSSPAPIATPIAK